MTRIAKLDYPKLDIRMYVSTPIEESHRITACAKEPWTVEWIESMSPGSVLYDVGANVGPYTLLAAALGHTVVAIEPGFSNFNRLCENILLNDLGPKVIPLCLAVGPEHGSIELMAQELQPGFSGGTKRLRVPMMPLVALSEVFGVSSPTHIKLDTDGSEASVIEGWSYQDGDPCNQSWLVEVQTGQEQRINDLLGKPTQVWTHRDGQWAPRAPGRIPGMSMMLFEPAAVKV